MIATRFAHATNIFTGEDPIRFVDIPQSHSKRKGETKYDAKFETLLDFKQALFVPDSEFSSMRKALRRFVDNKGMRDTVTVRQRKDARTNSYTIWLADEPPQDYLRRKGAP